MTFPEVMTAYIVTGVDMLLSVRAGPPGAAGLRVGILPASPGFVRSETMVCWEASAGASAPSWRHTRRPVTGRQRGEFPA